MTEPAVEPSVKIPEPPSEGTLIDEYDQFEQEVVGIQPQPKEEPETKVEEPPKEEPTEPTKTEDAPEPEPQKHKIKHDGQEVELTYDELLEKARHGFDYTKKTQALAEERKQWETQKSEHQKEAQVVFLENLALQVGGKLRKPVFDVYGDTYDKMVNTYGKEVADNFLKENELVNDQADFAIKDQKYSEWMRNAQAVLNNRTYADSENNKNIEAFKTKYSLSQDEVDSLLEQGKEFLNYAVSKGQVPLPANTYEVMYRGMNFEKLLKAETDKLNADWEAKLKKEKETLVDEIQNRNVKPKVTPTKITKPVSKEEKTLIDEVEEDILTGKF